MLSFTHVPDCRPLPSRPWVESFIAFQSVFSASKPQPCRTALLETLSLLWPGALPPSVFLLDIYVVWESGVRALPSKERNVWDAETRPASSHACLQAMTYPYWLEEGRLCVFSPSVWLENALDHRLEILGHAGDHENIHINLFLSSIFKAPGHLSAQRNHKQLSSFSLPSWWSKSCSQ